MVNILTWKIHGTIFGINTMNGEEIQFDYANMIN